MISFAVISSVGVSVAQIPAISSVTPNTTLAGGPAFIVTVSGAGFMAASVVRWNGADRPTSFGSPTNLTASIPASDIASAGSASVTVFNPGGGGGTSNAVTFTINAPVPIISGLSPNSAIAGGGAFTLTLTGSGFVSGSVVRWNGVNRATSFGSPTNLTASIPASDIASAGSATLTVFNPAPGGGTSNGVTFTILAANPVPSISSLSPNSAIAGGGAFTLTLTGSGFVSGSVVRWNGANRTTTFGSSTSLTASIPASDIASAGNTTVTVFNPAPGGGTSNGVTLTILAGADLTVTKSHTGNFTQGQTGATYTITVSNFGGVPTSGTVTVSDTLPLGLTATAASGSGWGCTIGPPGMMCTRSDALAPGGSYPPITVTVTVASNAPASLTNLVAVSGGGDVNAANNTASDPTTIMAGPDLTVTKSHTGNFTQGQVGAEYSITVTNSGNGPTSGTVTMSDTLPAGLTPTTVAGPGWSCSLSSATASCSRSDALAAGQTYPPITLTVTVASNAPASVTNSVSVSGGGDVTQANNTASDLTPIRPAPSIPTLSGWRMISLVALLILSGCSRIRRQNDMAGAK